MPSEKQIEASRQNGRKSNGAVSAEGKARIVNANLKTGIYTRHEVLPWESADHLDQLKAEYYLHHAPASPEARLLVDELITCEWTLRRLHRIDTELWRTSAAVSNNPADGHCIQKATRECDQSFTRLQQRINSTRTAYHRALKELQKLEAAEPAPAPAGEPSAVAEPDAPQPDAAQPPTPSPQPPAPCPQAQLPVTETPKNPESGPASPEAPPEITRVN